MGSSVGQFLTADATRPAQKAVAVTPTDNTTIPTTRGLYVGGAGNVAVIMASGDTVTFSGVAAGTFMPIQVQSVQATNTTATLILALY